MVKLNTSFAYCFISVSWFCPRLPQVFCFSTSLGTAVPRHAENSTLPMPLDSQIIACHGVP